MRTRFQLRLAATVVAAAALTLASPLTASAGPNDLISADPSSVSVAAPAPGESREWTMSVRNLTQAELPLALEILGEGGQVLFTGPTPLQLSVEETNGDAVLNGVSVETVLGTAVELPALAPGATYTLNGSVTLPREADNRYQGVTGSLTLRFLATDDGDDGGGGGGGRLPMTGAELALPLAIAGVALSLVGVALLRRRSKGAQA